MSRDARLSDRIKQLSFDPSTGAFSLDSVATGFSPFSDFYEDGDIVFYAATDGTRYEVGSGEYTGGTVTRYPLRSNQISSGPYYLDAPSARESDAGVTGVWHPLYLTKSAASGLRGFNVAGGAVSPASGVHEHTFSGYPGVTFYMPNMEVAGHAQASSVTKSGESYATSGSPVSFQGVTEVFVSYPGKYSVFSAGGISGFNEPKSKGVAFWGNEQTLDYDTNIVWDTGVDALGVSQPSPIHPIDVGGLTAYSQVRASGFIGGGSGVQFSGGQALPQSSLKTASGGRQLEPFYRNELDTQTKSDQVFSLSGLVDERLLLKQQIKGSVFAGPASGCTATCSPDYPEFRYLEPEDIPDLSVRHVVQRNFTGYGDIPAGSVAFTTSSGNVEYSAGNLVFSKSTNRLGVNTESPDVTLSVNGDAKTSGNLGISGWLEVAENVRVGGNIVVSGNLDVQGDVTYIDSTQVMVVDKQLELASMSGAALHNHGALDSGGIILKSTDGDQFWIYSSGSLDGSAYDPAWVTDADIWTSGGAIRFNDGPTISGGYHAGSGLELHNGVAFNVGNLFQVSGNDGTNGFIHQGSILTVSGISGVNTTFTQLDNSGSVTIDPTYMYNALSGAIEQVDGASNQWKIHVTSGTWHGFDYDDPNFPSGHILETVDSALAVSGISGISLVYASGADDGPGFFISAAPISGYIDGRINGLAGGYGNWKINASGGNLEHGEIASGILLDEITAGQAVSFSGVEGLEVAYDATVNYMTFGAAPLSGLFTHVMGTEVLDSGATNMIINSGDRVLQIASGLATVASGHAIDVSGYTEARVAALGGGYVNWKVNASGGNLEHGEVASGILLDEITAGQAISFSGVEGIEVAYDATVNYMTFGAAPLSGYFNTTLGDEALVSGVTQLVINSGNAAIAVAAGSLATYGSGLYRDADGKVDLRPDGSGTLKHLIFSHGVRIGEGAGVGISGLDSLDASGTGVPIPDSGIGTGSVFIGSLAGSGSINLFPISGIFIGHQAGALSSGNQDSIFIGRSAGQNADAFDEVASGQAFDNIGIGRNAARALLNSDNSTFIGLEAGYEASGNQSTVAVGQFAASGLEKSEDSVFIGTNAGVGSSGILRSNFIGRDAGGEGTASSGVGDDPLNFTVRSGVFNFDQSNMIGYRAGAGAIAWSGVVGGSGHVGSSGVNFIGSNAGADSLYCDATDFIGSFAGYKASGLMTSVGLGNRAYEEAIDSQSGVAIGAEASCWSSGELFVNSIGVKAGLSSSGNSYCNFMGYGAGAESGPSSLDISGVYSTGVLTGKNQTINAIGRLAFYRGSGCKYSDFIGYAAGQHTVDVDNSFVAGFQAGIQGEDFDSCVIIGNAVANSRSGIQSSVILGDQAGGKSSATVKGDLQKFEDTILIGRKAGYGASGLDNVVAIGTQAANNAGVSGIPYTYGIFIGHQAGYSQDLSTTRMPGDKNLIISTNAQEDDACDWAPDNQDDILSIGYLMHGYTEHSSSYSNRHLQIGKAPNNLTELQEATLTVSPDSFGHIGLRLAAAPSQSAALLEAEVPSTISSSNNVVINKEGFAQILVATYSPSAGEYQTASGMSSTIGKYPGTVIVFDDSQSSTKELLVCLSDGAGGGRWYKLDDDLVVA